MARKKRSKTQTVADRLPGETDEQRATRKVAARQKKALAERTERREKANRGRLN